MSCRTVINYSGKASSLKLVVPPTDFIEYDSLPDKKRVRLPKKKKSREEKERILVRTTLLDLCVNKRRVSPSRIAQAVDYYLKDSDFLVAERIVRKVEKRYLESGKHPGYAPFCDHLLERIYSEWAAVDPGRYLSLGNLYLKLAGEQDGLARQVKEDYPEIATNANLQREFHLRQAESAFEASKSYV